MQASPELREKVELFISCTNIQNRDLTGKSDPYVSILCTMRNQTLEVGRTEVMKNSLNPDFKKPVVIDYWFELNQDIAATVWDEDGQNDDSLGDAKFRLSEVITSKGPLIKPITRNGKPAGQMSIRYEKVASSKKYYYFKIACSKVKDIEWFSKSDPFLRIYRPALGFEKSTIGAQVGNWAMVYESEFYKNNLNPSFNGFELNSSILNYSNPEVLMKIEIWDNSSKGNHELIGTGYSSVRNIIEGNRNIESQDKSGKYSGTIVIQEFREQSSLDLIDYIRGGLQMSLTIAVDFTGSNGSPSNPSSLHYLSPQKPNQYQEAIYQVGSIMVNYDNDRLIPTYGFGARVNGVYSDCFPLSFDPANPFLQSFEGVLQAYKDSIPKVELYGPTNFAPVIRQLYSAAKSAYDKGNILAYSVLMIMTDGLITDEAATIEAIVDCAMLPISIIIIGVGNESFAQMNVLDSDGKGLRDRRGVTAVRDIVQFVPYKQFAHNPPALAEAVLRELPGQVNKFYNMIGYIPKV